MIGAPNTQTLNCTGCVMKGVRGMAIVDIFRSYDLDNNNKNNNNNKYMCDKNNIK